MPPRSRLEVALYLLRACAKKMERNFPPAFDPVPRTISFPSTTRYLVRRNEFRLDHSERALSSPGASLELPVSLVQDRCDHLSDRGTVIFGGQAICEGRVVFDGE